MQPVMRHTVHRVEVLKRGYQIECVTAVQSMYSCIVDSDATNCGVSPAGGSIRRGP